MLQQRDHFALMGLEKRFAIDMQSLEQGYRSLQSRIHPDRYAAEDAAAQRQSLELATQANEAYRTLKHPVARARYLLSLRGTDTAEDSNTTMPGDFLMLQMEWRESIEEAGAVRDLHALELLARKLRQELNGLEAGLCLMLDVQHDDCKAAETVRKCRFYERMMGDIDARIDELMEG